jgi:LL-diaminopimelate aminotransferase
MEIANRLQGIGEYYFSQKLREIEQLNQQDAPSILNLGIGSPDLPPHPDVINCLHHTSLKTDHHAYQSYKGSPILRHAVAKWYFDHYNVEINPNTEILPLIGSKEGIMHICMTYLNPGDIVLVPNPGYPTYSAAVKLAGGTVREYLLEESGKWMPDLESLRGTDAKIMFVNYPHMPSGQSPSRAFFEELIRFAREENILLIHDNPYSFILNEEPLSLLSVEGAKDVALELNSLSKSHNMAGWRVGALLGSAFHIENVLRFKSNMDSGMFLPVQLAAATALSLDKSWYESQNVIYRRRRQIAFRIMEALDCTLEKDQTGMFLWGRIPENYTDSYQYSDEVLHSARVFVTPGGIFGSQGNKYLRLSLCTPETGLQTSLNRILQYKSQQSAATTQTAGS